MEPRRNFVFRIRPAGLPLGHFGPYFAYPLGQRDEVFSLNVAVRKIICKVLKVLFFERIDHCVKVQRMQIELVLLRLIKVRTEAIKADGESSGWRLQMNQPWKNFSIAPVAFGGLSRKAEQQVPVRLDSIQGA